MVNVFGFSVNSLPRDVITLIEGCVPLEPIVYLNPLLLSKIKQSDGADAVQALKHGSIICLCDSESDVSLVATVHFSYHVPKTIENMNSLLSGEAERFSSENGSDSVTFVILNELASAAFASIRPTHFIDDAPISKLRLSVVDKDLWDLEPASIVKIKSMRTLSHSAPSFSALTPDDVRSYQSRYTLDDILSYPDIRNIGLPSVKLDENGDLKNLNVFPLIQKLAFGRIVSCRSVFRLPIFGTSFSNSASSPPISSTPTHRFGESRLNEECRRLYEDIEVLEVIGTPNVLNVYRVGDRTRFHFEESVYPAPNVSFNDCLSRCNLLSPGRFKSILQVLSLCMPVRVSEQENVTASSFSSCGIILSGPSGSGKRHLAESVAVAMACPIFSVKAHDLYMSSPGESERRISLIDSACSRLSREFGGKPTFVMLESIENIMPLLFKKNKPNEKNEDDIDDEDSSLKMHSGPASPSMHESIQQQKRVQSGLIRLIESLLADNRKEPVVIIATSHFSEDEIPPFLFGSKRFSSVISLSPLPPMQRAQFLHGCLHSLRHLIQEYDKEQQLQYLEVYRHCVAEAALRLNGYSCAELTLVVREISQSFNEYLTKYGHMESTQFQSTIRDVILAAAEFKRSNSLVSSIPNVASQWPLDRKSSLSDKASESVSSIEEAKESEKEFCASEALLSEPFWLFRPSSDEDSAPDDMPGSSLELLELANHVELLFKHANSFYSFQAPSSDSAGDIGVKASVAVGMSSGLLLSGPSGSGKTLSAQVIGRYVEKMGIGNVIVAQASDIISATVGVSERNLRDLFERARRLRPCLLIVDQFHILAPSRLHSEGIEDASENDFFGEINDSDIDKDDPEPDFTEAGSFSKIQPSEEAELSEKFESFSISEISPPVFSMGVSERATTDTEPQKPGRGLLGAVRARNARQIDLTQPRPKARKPKSFAAAASRGSLQVGNLDVSVPQWLQRAKAEAATLERMKANLAGSNVSSAADRLLSLLLTEIDGLGGDKGPQVTASLVPNLSDLFSGIVNFEGNTAGEGHFEGCPLKFEEAMASIAQAASKLIGNESLDPSMDSFSSLRDSSSLFTPPVVLLAITAQPHLLDPAVLRPGRLDVHIRMKFPTLRERCEILYSIFSRTALNLSDDILDLLKNAASSELEPNHCPFPSGMPERLQLRINSYMDEVVQKEGDLFHFFVPQEYESPSQFVLLKFIIVNYLGILTYGFTRAEVTSLRDFACGRVIHRQMRKVTNLADGSEHADIQNDSWIDEDFVTLNDIWEAFDDVERCRL